MTDRAYARISLDTLASGSIAKQRARLSAVTACELEWYVDESVSGSKIPFAERPDGGRLLGDLRPGDRVLVTKIDRAARNVRDLLGLVEHIEAVGASIVFIDQNIDTAGPMGRFLLTLLGAVAELEAETIAERRRESLAQFAAEGRHAVGRAPFGLRSVCARCWEPRGDAKTHVCPEVRSPGAGRGLILRPDPDAAPLLREAVAAILSGDSQRAWSGRCGMQHPAFGRLLRNPRLAGVQGVDGDGDLRVDPEQGVFTLGEWQRLQDYLGLPPGRRETPGTAAGYAAAFRCSVCGDRLYLNAARNPAYATYRCRGARHADGQPAASVMRTSADRVAVAEFMAAFGALRVIDVLEESSSEARDEAVARARVQLDLVRAAQDAAESEEDEEALAPAYRRAKRDLRAAEALPSETVRVVVPTAERYADVWGTAPDSERTAMLMKLGPWTVSPGRLPLSEKVTREPETEPDYLVGQVG